MNFQIKMIHDEVAHAPLPSNDAENRAHCDAVYTFSYISRI